MRRFIVLALACAAITACGAPAHSGQATGKGGPAAVGTAVAAPMPAAAADGSLTAAQVRVVAEQSFPLIQPYGYYAVCGLTGDTTACPYTPRLKARLAEQRVTLSRAQNPAPAREVAVELTGPATGIAHVKLGTTALDLDVVLSDGQVLVDDESCMGRAGSSIYETIAAC